MNILLPILIASTPVTSDFPCWEIRNGQVIDLTYLCEIVEVSPEINEAAFLADIEESLSSPLILSILDTLDPVGSAQNYCTGRQDGLSDEEFIAAFDSGVASGISQDATDPETAAEITMGLAEYADAITTLSPEYFCPEFS